MLLTQCKSVWVTICVKNKHFSHPHFVSNVGLLVFCLLDNLLSSFGYFRVLFTLTQKKPKIKHPFKFTDWSRLFWTAAVNSRAELYIWFGGYGCKASCLILALQCFERYLESFEQNQRHGILQLLLFPDLCAQLHCDVWEGGLCFHYTLKRMQQLLCLTVWGYSYADFKIFFSW